jgi:hypothetical protein
MVELPLTHGDFLYGDPKMFDITSSSREALLRHLPNLMTRGNQFINHRKPKRESL